ncbi:MAG: VOC family protein [Gammaproteobacteria bacterium]|nr:VOC family protein [Gammaproteobacteria bacterium]NNC98301.1 VOC family protein [Gammaproteobacteria bacterium]NNM12777.1 VOC family protein [Gammaproteobacteria bacterium]
MIPVLNKIDHVHIYVPERDVAAEWYKQNLGFSIIKEFEFWAEHPGGPLTISHGEVHLALFKRDRESKTEVAFGVSGEDFLQWKTHLEKLEILDRCNDHGKAWSLYFRDPYENHFEITTYDHDFIVSNSSLK